MYQKHKERNVEFDTAEVFEDLLAPSRYKGAHGGRGSAKSRFFASLAVEYAIAYKPLNMVCIREVQKTLAMSAKKLIEDTLISMKIGRNQGFRIFKDRIQLPGDGVMIFQGMQDHTAESIKSLEGFNVAWCEESQTISENSLKLLRPTIRQDSSEGNISELWFSWNPRRKSDPVNMMFRDGKPPTNSVVVESNWRDNPWFPDVLEQERLDCLENEPDDYDHVWEGGYVGVSKHAYYSKQLLRCRQESRITFVPVDKLMTCKAFVDIGGTGSKSDAFAIWVAQFIGNKINVLKSYEAQGQDVAYHVNWLKLNGFGPGACKIYLPHDGATNDRVIDVSYESAFKSAGFDVEVVTNQGKGASMARIQKTREIFHIIHFDKNGCRDGLEALGHYKEKKDKVRLVGLGPDHDWASHAADAFGLMCICYKKPRVRHSGLSMISEF